MIYHWLEGLSYASVPESELVVMGKEIENRRWHMGREKNIS
jgi:hypothetical protein